MELILHIGLPKTGTTTMQYGLFSLADNLDFYLGKFSDREDGFHGAVSDFLSGRVSATEARGLIAPALEGTGVRLYSNEMITVSSTLTWTEKLARLSALFAGHRLSVVATTRLPSKLGPSVFAELQPAMPWSDFEDFLRDPQSLWLNPELLYDAIVASGLAPAERIFFFDFDTLIAQDFRPLGNVLSGLSFPDTISAMNARKRVGNNIVSRQIGLYDVAYRLMRKLGLEKMISARIRGYGGRVLRAIPFGWCKQIELRTDAPELQSLDETYRNALPSMSAYGRPYGNGSKNDFTE